MNKLVYIYLYTRKNMSIIFSCIYYLCSVIIIDSKTNDHI